MSKSASTTTDAAAIRACIEQWAAASRARDIDAIMAAYAADVRAFDAIGELQFQGAAAYRQHWETCLSYMQGDMLFEVHDLEVAVDGDLAFAHYLARCGGTGTDGIEHAGWIRGTVCLRRTGGRWLIVHEHYSVPFDPATSKALSDLQRQAAGPSSAA